MRRVQRNFGCCFDNAPRAARLARLLRQPRRFRRRLPPQAQRAWSEPMPRVPRPRQVDRPRSSGGRAASRRWPAWPLRRPRSVLHARGREHGVAKVTTRGFPHVFSYDVSDSRGARAHRGANPPSALRASAPSRAACRALPPGAGARVARVRPLSRRALGLRRVASAVGAAPRAGEAAHTGSGGPLRRRRRGSGW